MKVKCHVDHANERWWVLRNGKQTCCCCGAVMRKKKRKPSMTRKQMDEIKRGIMSAYPKGTRMFVIMPGEKIPDELKP